MKILITAGNTQSPIDSVRCITNIFTGRTGAAIAHEASRRGHHVTIATSHPETITSSSIQICPYRIYEDLESVLQKELTPIDSFDVIIMAAAINDYHVEGAYSLANSAVFDASRNRLNGDLKPMHDPKIRGNHPELWLRLVPAPKLIDRIRRDWGFQGTLVKFKLEVNVTDDQLLKIAEDSRKQSQANWLVANTLEGKNDWAYLLGEHASPLKVDRSQLASCLLDKITT
jgi:phosphopantothenate---cysteine ligase (CTP)